MGGVTRKERDKTALQLALDFLTGEADDLTKAEIVEGIRFALLGGDAPPWWAEVVYEMRAINREYREQARDVRVRCEPCEGRGWLDASTARQDEA